MKSLWWKEWRENRLLLLVGVLLVAGFSLIPLLYGVTSSFTIGGSAVVFLAGLFGAEAFSKEKGKLNFLLSSPVERKTVISVKLASGILNILILLLIALVIERTIFYTNGFDLLIYPIKGRSLPPGYSITKQLLSDLSLYISFSFLVYSAAFLMSILLSETIVALLTGYLTVGIINGIFAGVAIALGLNQSAAISLLWHFTLFLLFIFLSYLIFTRKEIRE